MVRLSVFRAFIPRATAPLLPTSSLRLTSKPLRSTSKSLWPTSSRLCPLFPVRFTSTTTPNPQSNLPPDATLSQRLKHLIKSYGWYALGVYLVLSALDFGVAFVGVNLLGAEYVSHAVTSIKSFIFDFLPTRPPEPGLDEIDNIHPPQAQSGQEGFYAILVLAYTIHKTLFLPVRVGLTAAFTPRLVGWLGRRGWVGSAGTQRAADELREKLRRGGGNSP